MAARLMETMSLEAIHTFCERGVKEKVYIIFTRMICKVLSHELECPSKTYFQTLMLLTVKDILKFNSKNSNHLQLKFSLQLLECGGNPRADMHLRLIHLSLLP